MKRQRIALAVVLALITLPVGGMHVSAETANAPPAVAQPSPTIEFVTPHGSDRINDYPIFVETRVTGFTLAPPVQFWDRVQQADKFLGHIHYTLDDGPIFATRSTHIVLGKPMGKSLPAGTHILRAELVNINHNPLNPPVFVEIPLVCEHVQKDGKPAPQDTIPIDANGRKQLHKVEQDLQDTQQQLLRLKARLRDVQ